MDFVIHGKDSETNSIGCQRVIMVERGGWWSRTWSWNSHVLLWAQNYSQNQAGKTRNAERWSVTKQEMRFLKRHYLYAIKQCSWCISQSFTIICPSIARQFLSSWVILWTFPGNPFPTLLCPHLVSLVLGLHLWNHVWSLLSTSFTKCSISVILACCLFLSS